MLGIAGRRSRLPALAVNLPSAATRMPTPAIVSNLGHSHSSFRQSSINACLPMPIVTSQILDTRKLLHRSKANPLPGARRGSFGGLCEARYKPWCRAKSDALNSQTPSRESFKINLNGELVTIATVGLAYPQPTLSKVCVLRTHTSSHDLSALGIIIGLIAKVKA